MKHFVKLLVAALFAACTICAASVSHVSAAQAVDVTIPEFSILINGNKISNSYAKYPCIFYKDITYFPMTYNDSRALGLAADWTAEKGLVISKTDTAPRNPDFEQQDDKNTDGTATVAAGKITVNGKVIDNSVQEYPILLFRDITYFPLTWKIAVEEFGWNYRFTSQIGLEIALDAEDMKDNTTENAVGACGDNLTWIFDESTGTLTISGTGDMWNYGIAPWEEYQYSYVEITDGVTSIGNCAFRHRPDIIPPLDQGLPVYFHSALESITIPTSVTSIGRGAFYDCDALTSIVIPSNVTSIEKYAFYDCDALTSIIIPESVTDIENSVFYDCDALTSIIIPESAASIGDFAFYGCNALTNIAIPESVTSIGTSAFYDCDALTSIIIPESVTSIGRIAFYGCNALTSINVDKNNKNYTSEDGILFSKDKKTIICYPISKKEIEYIIPDSVTNIEDYAFCNCISLKSITVPHGVTSIGKRAFEFCYDLTSITIPDSVTSIGEMAFRDCYDLNTINFTGTKEQWDAFGLKPIDISYTKVTFGK